MSYLWSGANFRSKRFLSPPTENGEYFARRFLLLVLGISMPVMKAPRRYGIENGR